MKSLPSHDNIANFLGVCLDFDIGEDKRKPAVVLIAPTVSLRRFAGDPLPLAADIARAIAQLFESGYELAGVSADNFSVDTTESNRPRAVLTNLRSAQPVTQVSR